MYSTLQDVCISSFKIQIQLKAAQCAKLVKKQAIAVIHVRWVVSVTQIVGSEPPVWLNFEKIVDSSQQDKQTKLIAPCPWTMAVRGCAAPSLPNY